MLWIRILSDRFHYVWSGSGLALRNHETDLVRIRVAHKNLQKLQEHHIFEYYIFNWKKFRIKVKIFLDLRSDPEPDPLLQETDLRIQIKI